MAVNMPEKAFRVIPNDTHLILHSGHGRQYRHKLYQRMLKEKGIRQTCVVRVIVRAMRLSKISLACLKASRRICSRFSL